MKRVNAFCTAILMTWGAVFVTPSAVNADDAVVPDFTQPFTITFSNAASAKDMRLLTNTYASKAYVSEESLPYLYTATNNFGATTIKYADLYYRKSDTEPAYGYLDFNSGEYNTGILGSRLQVPIAKKIRCSKIILEARTDVKAGVSVRVSTEKDADDIYEDSYYEDVNVAYGDEFAYYTVTFPVGFWENHQTYPDGRNSYFIKLDRYADEAKTTLAHCEIRSITIVPSGSDWTPPGEIVKTPVSLTVAGSTGEAGTDCYYRQLDEYRMDGDLVSTDYPKAFFIPMPVVRDAAGETVPDITAFDFDIAIDPIPYGDEGRVSEAPVQFVPDENMILGAHARTDGFYLMPREAGCFNVSISLKGDCGYTAEPIEKRLELAPSIQGMHINESYYFVGGIVDGMNCEPGFYPFSNLGEDIDGSPLHPWSDATMGHKEENVDIYYIFDKNVSSQLRRAGESGNGTLGALPTESHTLYDDAAGVDLTGGNSVNIILHKNGAYSESVNYMYFPAIYDSVTGIDGVEADFDAGSECWYTLTGARVSDITKAPSGFYIRRNGTQSGVVRR